MQATVGQHIDRRKPATYTGVRKSRGKGIVWFGFVCYSILYNLKSAQYNSYADKTHILSEHLGSQRESSTDLT